MSIFYKRFIIPKFAKEMFYINRMQEVQILVKIQEKKTHENINQTDLRGGAILYIDQTTQRLTYMMNNASRSWRTLTTPMTDGSQPLYKARKPSSR